MKLWEYDDKRVRITSISGRVFTGLVDRYTSELDSPDGVASISLDPDGRDDVYINFEESEIASIEIIPADNPIYGKSNIIFELPNSFTVNYP